MKKIVVPYHPQEQEHTCGPASLRMVLSYFNDHFRESQLARRAQTIRLLGTPRRHLVALARRRGYRVYEKSNATISLIEQFINRELPVIVNYIEPTDNQGHYAVVTGYDAKGLFLHDPWNGKDFHLSRKTFQRRWRGETDKKERWLMVISRL